MAIGQIIRPVVLVEGHVERVSELKRKDDGSIFALEVHLKQPHDGIVKFKMFESDFSQRPSVGDFCIVECSVSESGQYGTELAYERPGFDALDRIHALLKKAA